MKSAAVKGKPLPMLQVAISSVNKDLGLNPDTKKQQKIVQYDLDGISFEFHF